MDVYYRRGLWLKLDGKKFLIDPTAKSSLANTEYTLVSHGHTDHASAFKNLSSANIRSSRITEQVINTRYGVGINQIPSDVKMYNAGHVMGSTQFMIGDILYTGDLNTANQLSVEPAETPSADTLIVEATYGAPKNTIPKHEETLEKIDAFVEDAFSRDRPAVFYAYSLGKAQELSVLLQKHKLFVDAEIYDMNKIYSHNIEKIKCHKLPQGIEFDRNDFAVIYTTKHMRQNKHLLAKMWGTNTPMTGVATGWATVGWFSGGVAKKSALDGIFPLSSHADFNGLCDFVDAVAPKKVYTVYGSTKELAKALCDKGYDAKAVRAEKTVAPNPVEKCRAY